MADCIFCKIAAHDAPAAIRYEDEDVVAFDDIGHRAPLHVLVIPRRHVASLTEADPRTIGQVGSAAARIAQDAGYGERGYRVVTNVGPDAGQSVPHLHFHVLAGRELGWPPG